MGRGLAQRDQFSAALVVSGLRRQLTGLRFDDLLVDVGGGHWLTGDLPAAHRIGGGRQATAWGALLMELTPERYRLATESHRAPPDAGRVDALFVGRNGGPATSDAIFAGIRELSEGDAPRAHPAARRSARRGHADHA